MTPLNIPLPGEPISATDFVRLINRAQAIVLVLQGLDVGPHTHSALEQANEEMKRAMRCHVQRR